MAIPSPSAGARSAAPDHGFHKLRVKRVVRETADASSFVLDVPADLRGAFAYEAGQFCTFRATVSGEEHLRCYSMSSSPAVDDEVQVTVKRVPGGTVSNWMNDELSAGDAIDVTRPAGVFRLGEAERDIVAFAGGSGITPVFSILKTALAATSRRVHMLYANRDSDSVIFAAEIAALTDRYGRRLEVVHHFDVERGFVDSDELQPFVDVARDADVYICGPGPFMDVVEHTLIAHGIDAGRVHIERFTPMEPPPLGDTADEAPGAVQVTIELNGRTGVTEYRHGMVLLQMARQLGMSPPFSCEAGNCATCMARIVEGAATMHVNNALTPDEVAGGWVLTCQAVPTTPSVHVVYGYEDS
jgi:3-ketosteroid 9alpha-monooxygenase subunit B